MFNAFIYPGSSWVNFTSEYTETLVYLNTFYVLLDGKKMSAETVNGRDGVRADSPVYGH